MKQNKLCTQVLLACYSRPVTIKTNIHEQLAATIAERKKMMRQWEWIYGEKPAAGRRETYMQLSKPAA
jgi:hypothetical protein